MTAHKVQATIDEAAIDEFLTGTDIEAALQAFGWAVTVRAVQKTGVKTGNLRRSLEPRVVNDDDGLAVEWTSDVPYAIHHMAPGKPDGPRAGWRGTRPFTRTFDELGIEYELKDGYPV